MQLQGPKRTQSALKNKQTNKLWNWILKLQNFGYHALPFCQLYTVGGPVIRHLSASCFLSHCMWEGLAGEAFTVQLLDTTIQGHKQPRLWLLLLWVAGCFYNHEVYQTAVAIIGHLVLWELLQGLELLELFAELHACCCLLSKSLVHQCSCCPTILISSKLVQEMLENENCLFWDCGCM